MDPLGTDSCRETVPMEPPMSNGSMRHQNPDLDFDDTHMILQGASCTIAVCSVRRTLDFEQVSHRLRYGHTQLGAGITGTAVDAAACMRYDGCV
jgi:hypothetical protein